MAPKRVVCAALVVCGLLSACGGNPADSNGLPQEPQSSEIEAPVTTVRVVAGEVARTLENRQIREALDRGLSDQTLVDPFSGYVTREGGRFLMTIQGVPNDPATRLRLAKQLTHAFRSLPQGDRRVVVRVSMTGPGGVLEPAD